MTFRHLLLFRAILAGTRFNFCLTRMYKQDKGEETESSHEKRVMLETRMQDCLIEAAACCDDLLKLAPEWGFEEGKLLAHYAGIKDIQGGRYEHREPRNDLGPAKVIDLENCA